MSFIEFLIQNYIYIIVVLIIIILIVIGFIVDKSNKRKKKEKAESNELNPNMNPSTPDLSPVSSNNEPLNQPTINPVNTMNSNNGINPAINNINPLNSQVNNVNSFASNSAGTNNYQANFTEPKPINITSNLEMPLGQNNTQTASPNTSSVNPTPFVNPNPINQQVAPNSYGTMGAQTINQVPIQNGAGQTFSQNNTAYGQNNMYNQSIGQNNLNQPNNMPQMPNNLNMNFVTSESNAPQEISNNNWQG